MMTHLQILEENKRISLATNLLKIEILEAREELIKKATESMDLSGTGIGREHFLIALNKLTNL